MSEAYADPRLVDKVTFARTIRGASQGLSFKLMTGEEPSVTYGWQRSTCLDQYAELDVVGRLAIRTAPTGFGLFLAGVALHLPLRAPSGPVLLAVAYLVLTWVLVTFYDPLVGVAELANAVRERRGVSA